MSSSKWLAPFSLACLLGACLTPKYDVDPTIDEIGGSSGALGNGVAGATAGATVSGGGAISSSAGAPGAGSHSAGAASGGKPGVSGGKGGASGAGAGGAPGGAGATAGGAAGGSSLGGSINCPDEVVGAAGKAAAAKASTAVVVLDDVVIRDATNTKILFQWQFADDKAIADTTTDPRPADQWSRSQYFGDMNKLSRAPGAHSTFLACDGSPDVGSLKNTIPFTGASQYYEASALFAAHDYSSATVTANVKLVTGGAEDITCPAHALLYAVSGGTETPGSPITLTEGVWKNLALTFPATGFTVVSELGIRVTTYPCL